MKGVINYFSISKEYADLADISFETEAILIHSVSNEERSTLSDEFKKKHPNVELLYVEEIGYEQIKLSNSNTEIYYNLRNKSNLIDLTNKFIGRPVYLDFTGLTHNSWAWLIRGLLYRKEGNLWALYSEPYEYKLHETPLDGQIFDLSEKINGLAPLAGLARLTNYRTTNFLFMPLLGLRALACHILWRMCNQQLI